MYVINYAYSPSKDTNDKQRIKNPKKVKYVFRGKRYLRNDLTK
jgi:hypothetical protein